MKDDISNHRSFFSLLGKTLNFIVVYDFKVSKKPKKYQL